VLSKLKLSPTPTPHLHARLHARHRRIAAFAHNPQTSV
jgi:hypothetical protein